MHERESDNTSSTSIPCKMDEGPWEADRNSSISVLLAELFFC
jgi:hypothetical protein